MPAYITHAIMADQLVKNYHNDNNIFKISADINNMRTFSLGVDLCHFSKADYNSHNKDTLKFFYYFTEYIKDNKLWNDSKVMSCLYGHILHYFLDISLHPLVYYLEINSKRSNRFISNHSLIEGYYDQYLLTKYNYGFIKPSFFNKGNLKDDNTVVMINNVYNYTYNVKNVINSYKKVISILTLLEQSTKGLIKKEYLMEYSGFNKFLKENEYTIETLLNTNNELWQNPITGDYYNETFDNLFDYSIKRALEAINIVNDYIYNNRNKSIISRVFEDLSYDTGVKCSYGRKFKYTKKGLNK